MGLKIVRLGSARAENEGVRIGTVRRPPRGVPKSEYAAQNWYDVWLPNIAPTAELMKVGQAVETESDWAAFCKRFRRELAAPEKAHVLDLLAVLSQTTNFSAKTRSDAIAPSCASCWRSGAPGSTSQHRSSWKESAGATGPSASTLPQLTPEGRSTCGRR